MWLNVFALFYLITYDSPVSVLNKLVNIYSQKGANVKIVWNASPTFKFKGGNTLIQNKVEHVIHYVEKHKVWIDGIGGNNAEAVISTV